MFKKLKALSAAWSKFSSVKISIYTVSSSKAYIYREETKSEFTWLPSILITSVHPPLPHAPLPVVPMVI